MQANYKYRLRYIAIAVIFCTVCIIYLGRLFYIQINGGKNDEDKTVTKTVTVSAVRGEIYDRNGKPLVTNRYSYDLTLSHTALSALGTRAANETCLSLLEALEKNEEAGRHAELYFPFDGTYPNYTFSEEATDGDSILYYRLRRVLKALNLDADATAEEITDRYTELYGLTDRANDGSRLFDDREADRLMRLRYDMDAHSFRTNGEYTLAEEIGLSTMTYVKELSLEGVIFSVNTERVYHYPGYASHILGTVGPIYSEEWEYYNEQGYQMNVQVGKSGCELAFEAYLHGSDGKLKLELDENGNVLNTEVLTEPVSGSDVYLTIDIDLQIAAEDSLAENVESVSTANAGAAVVMDPDTFAVLAIASNPTYDLSTYGADYNDLLANVNKPLLNRALSGLYAPGSTFKPGVAAAALENQLIDADSTVLCRGKYFNSSDYQPACSTYEDHASTFGTTRLTAAQAIAVSCNVFFYEMGNRLGVDRMNAYLSGLGFGQSTGIELGDRKGALAGPDYRAEMGSENLWQPGDVWQSAIGQSDNQTTPIQLASYLSTLLGGTRYNAHLLDRVYRFGEDTPYYISEQTVLSEVSLSESTRQTILEGLRGVVENNTYVKEYLRDIPSEIIVGGKTGTAQNSTGIDNALFVCAAPLDDPELVISVVIEQGRSGSYAAITAAGVLEAYFGQN